MLHWLAGQRPPEGPTDPDATGYIEPPETPAPVFAVRAFKHAIFGTPQTTQTKPRRNSATDNGRPRNGEHRAARPGMARPMSASHAQTLAKQDITDIPDPMSSPTKGILLTPGTAAAKKKNVTFGEHVIDNEGKRASKNAVAGEYPGQFPDSEAVLGDDSDLEEDGLDRRRGSSKLTEALEEAREESRKRRSKSDKRTKKLLEDDIDVPPEFVEPKSESGKFWKREFDAYRTNTQREVKKLITKQKAAKSFAHAKDIQCTDLADDLRQERKKVETLEAKMEELSALMKDVSEQLLASRKEAEDRADELARLKRPNSRKDSMRPESGDFASLLPLERTASGQRVEREALPPAQDPVQRPSEPYQPPSQSEKPKMDLQTLRARVKTKPESSQLKSSEDIWAQSFGSSSLNATRSAGKRPVSPRIGLGTDDGGKAGALQSLDVNTLANGRQAERGSPPKSLDVESESQQEQNTARTRSTVPERQIRSDVPPQSPLQSPSLPYPATDVQPPTIQDRGNASEQRNVEEPKYPDDLSMPLPISSPFDDDKPPPPPPKHGSAPGGSRIVLPTRRPQLNGNTKENVSPMPTSSKVPTPQAEQRVQPSAMWSSINAPQPSKKNMTVTGKDGKEVPSDRLEAARARINARGRVAS